MTGQLSLFKGKRQRGVALPPPKEFALHCMIADLLRRWQMPGWVWTHFPAGEARSVLTGARLQRMGLQRGFPDFLFFHCAGRCCFLELKRRGGRLSEEQETIGAHLVAAGHGWLVTDDFDVAVAQLKAWKILR